MSLRRAGLGTTLAVLAATLFASPAAWAELTTICVPEHASSQVLSTNSAGLCPAKVIGKTTVKYRSEPLPSQPELETLDRILPHIRYEATGVGGKPTIRFSGVNVQIVNGEGKTASANGSGNLVVGYDENEAGIHKQTGSHNLIVGEQQTFTSYGGIVAGLEDSLLAPFASVTGGLANKAEAEGASVTGGFGNVAHGEETTVTGGHENIAEERTDVVSGGKDNRAEAEASWVGGGNGNKAKFSESALVGGLGDETKAVLEARL